MKIGLIDVDGHTKKKKWGAKIYPNIALGKIARYHIGEDDFVEWAEPKSLFNNEPYDILYISKIFGFSKDIDLTEYLYREVKKGGTGYDLTTTLPKEIDRLQPYYPLFQGVDNKTAYGMLTRGCVNKCIWCVVPTKEGAIYPYMDIEEIAIEGRTNIVLMDNNLLASGEYAKEQFLKIIRNGYRIDLNQAIDARMMNDDYASLMAKVKWIDNYIRFGCDTLMQIEECEEAIEMLMGKGFKGTFFLYTMIGAPNSNFEKDWQRIEYWWKRQMECRERKPGYNISFHIQPYIDFDNPNAIIPKWQRNMARWANNKALNTSFPFCDYQPRKGFSCSEYFE